MRRFLRERGRRGFTLIEVTVAMGILGLLSLALAAMAVTSFATAQSGKVRLRATYLAHNMLENLMANTLTNNDVLKYNNVRTDRTDTFPAGDQFCSAWKQAIETQLRPEAHGEIIVVNNSPRAGRMRITITILWPSRPTTGRVEMVGLR